MSSSKRPFVIGISGCTNGGKTTLSSRLHKTFINSVLLAQDDFYHPRDSAHLEYITELDSYNFDTIKAIDMEAFHAEQRRLVDSGRYDFVFLDGFLLYDDDKLALDRKYFLYLNKEECWRRRQSRNYCFADTRKYFDNCVWLEFLRYKQRCEAKYGDEIVFINGAQPVDIVFDFVLNDLKSLLVAT